MNDWKLNGTNDWTWYSVEKAVTIGPRQHGRWMAVCRMEDGTIRGARCGSKRQARAIARQYNGVVRHYRSRNWKKPELPKAQTVTYVVRWSTKGKVHP